MDLKELLRSSGVVGAGGAGFPSYAKLSGGVNLLLINGAECEPLLYTDFTLLQREMDRVLRGISALLEGAQIPRALLVIKEHTAKRLMLADGALPAPRIGVKTVADVYPIGDEIALIYEATGKLVQPGALPASAGVLVYNVETVYNIARALEGFGVFEKWVTVGGDVEHPQVVRVPVGTPVADLLAKLGISLGAEQALLDGGPSMGRLISPATAVVTKTTKGLLVLPKSCRAVESKTIHPGSAVARAETACCQCTRCTDLCPRALLGYPLEPHKMVRTAMGAARVQPEMVLSASLCSNCGICENLACSQGISPKAVINNYKELLRKHRLRYAAKTPVTVPKEREWRKIPSEKWAALLGVLRFDRVPPYGGLVEGFSTLRIPLNGSVPCVKSGDWVERGQKIADPAAGFSVALHASASGTVRVEEDTVIITSC